MIVNTIKHAQTPIFSYTKPMITIERPQVRVRLIYKTEHTPPLHRECQVNAVIIMVLAFGGVISLPALLCPI